MNPQVIAKEDPSRIATIMAGSGSSMTYGELDKLSRQISTLFRNLGLQPGDHIAFMVSNELMYHPVCWGAWFAGLYFTPISTRLTAGEIQYMIEDSQAKLVVASPAHESLLLQMQVAVPGVSHWYLTGPGLGTVPDIEESARGLLPLETTPETPIGVDMLYSSGTTGRPKGIKPALGPTRDDMNPLAGLFAKLYGLGPKSRYLTPAPLYHGSPTKFSLAVHRFGGTNVLMERFDAEAALQAIERHRVTHSQWVPTMFHRMIRLPDAVRSRYDLSSHEVAIHAAAPCPPDLKRQMLAWWGPIIHEFYAGSEAIGFTSITPDEWLAKPGSVGKSVLGELHIVEEGVECAPGETGDVYFANGPQLTYHNDPQKTAKAYNDRGWITLGDVGTLDEDGYLFLSDRKDFMIITGGVNVYPQEIENVLSMHPDVIDVAVFGLPNEEFGAEVKAVVQPTSWPADPDAYREELFDYCRAHLSPIKVPRSIDLTEALPRHPNGKLYKHRLRQEYLSGAAPGMVPVA